MSYFLLRRVMQSVLTGFGVILAGVFLISVIFVAINLIVDLLYGFLDPRVTLA